MAKSYKPMLLSFDQALRTVSSPEVVGGLQSVLYGVEGQVIPSQHQTLHRRYIRKLYRAGGYLKSTAEFTEDEKVLYLEPFKLLSEPQFLALLKRWNRSDLASAIKNRQRITGQLKRAVSTQNQRRLTEVFQLLFPAEIRQHAQHERSASGGRDGAKIKSKQQAPKYEDLTRRIKARAKSLLVTKEPRQIASILAREFGLSPTTIRNYMKK